MELENRSNVAYFSTRRWLIFVLRAEWVTWNKSVKLNATQCRTLANSQHNFMNLRHQLIWVHELETYVELILTSVSRLRHSSCFRIEKCDFALESSLRAKPIQIYNNVSMPISSQSYIYCRSDNRFPMLMPNMTQYRYWSSCAFVLIRNVVADGFDDVWVDDKILGYLSRGDCLRLSISIITKLAVFLDQATSPESSNIIYKTLFNWNSIGVALWLREQQRELPI